MSAPLSLAPHLADIAASLLASHVAGERITLDEVADAIGDAVITPDEIGKIIDALEAEGRPVDADDVGRARDHLRVILTVARSLRATLGRKATLAEIVTASGLSGIAVRHALAFARVLQR